MVGDISHDRLDEFLDACKRSTPDAFAGNLGEESFNEV